VWLQQERQRPDGPEGQWVGGSQMGSRLLVQWPGRPEGGGLVGWRCGHLLGLQGEVTAVAWRVSSGDVGVVAHLFCQCIVLWRSLPRARGSGC
jgi:hypothetical protein